MRLIHDDLTRLFSVVGGPFVAESHAETGGSGESEALCRSARDAAKLTAPCLTGWWLRDDD